MSEKDENAAALKALGIKTGVTYTVVRVRCCEFTCCSHNDCGIYAGDIGMTEDQDFQEMICHEYRSGISAETGTDKTVLWERVREGK